MKCPMLIAAIATMGLIATASFGQKCRADSTQDDSLMAWADSQNAQIFNDGFLEAPSHVRNDSSNAEVGWWDTSGRLRLMDTGEYSPTLAYESFYMNLNTHSPLLPHQLNDEAVSLGTPIGQFGAWGVSIALGAGYAGNSPYNDPSAIYGLAQITALDKISPEDSLYVSLNYNGNRTLMPDVPLPSVEFEHDGSTLQWTVGLPYESFNWQATSQLKISGEYDFITDGFADVDYAILQWLHLYTRFASDSWVFHTSYYNSDQRLFVNICRVEGGFRLYGFKNFLSIQMAGGYAFNQEFGQGFDDRDERNFAQIANAPYADIQLQLNF
jgi:hypothetical protein